MAVDVKEVSRDVVAGLSLLITQAMVMKTYHSWNPSHSADEDEAKMKRYGERMQQLRDLRNQFEDIMFGEIDD